MRKRWLVGAATLLAVVWAPVALADGTETLGSPSVPVASGTGVMVAGVGTEIAQPGQITFTVPGTPKQVFLYWTGHYTPPAVGDDTITVSGAKTFGRTIDLSAYDPPVWPVVASTAAAGGRTFAATAGTTFDCPPADYKYGNKFTLTEAGTVTALRAHMRGSGSGGSQQFRMLVYAVDATGGPGALLAASNPVTVAGTAAEGDVDFPLPSALALSPGTYFLMQQSGSAGGVACDAVDESSPNLNYWSFDPYADGPANPGGFMGTSPEEYSFSAVYTPAPGMPATVTGTSIGGPTCFFLQFGLPPCAVTNPIGRDFQTFRADITATGLVHAGANTLSVSGLDFQAPDGLGNDGAGVLVVYDDGTTSKVAGVRDGQDLAFVGFTGSLQGTVPQTFTFAPSSVARTATLSTLAASVAGPASGEGPLRPNELVLSFDVGGTVVLTNPWSSNAGPEYDAVNTLVTIPPGASSVSVEAVSGPGTASSVPLPASFAWSAATLTVPGGPPAGKTFGIGPSSMEGHLTIHPGDFFSGGYSFKFVQGKHVATQFTVAATVAVPVTCPQGGGSGGTITIPLGSKTYSVPAGNTDWLPTGDANSILSWMGSTVVPDLCGGKPMDNSRGAVFTATVAQNPPTGSLVDFRFKYRDPAAKGKPNTDCTVPGPNRDKADVCGASWSETVRDP